MMATCVARGFAVLLAIFVAGALVGSAAVAQPAGSELAPYTDTIAGTTVTFDMVPVPAGTVEVPGPDGPRTVEVGPFWIGAREVTWDEYDVFALGLDRAAPSSAADAIARPSRPYGAPDYGWGHAGYPVISVTRAAAEAYAAWLTAKTGRKYRLPTEAEWLHVARLAAGELPLQSERLDRIAWHAGNAGGRTHGVANKEPDALGLYDLFGNAAEWVMTDDDEPTTRGGSFRDAPEEVAAGRRAVQDESWTERDPQLPSSQWWLSDGPFVGFRLVREP